MADYYDNVVYRDVVDDVMGATASGAGLEPSSSDHHEETTAACLLYKFVVDSVNGLVCVLGFLGNIVAFVVFHKDTIKTSTSFLFQVVIAVDVSYICSVLR